MRHSINTHWSADDWVQHGRNLTAIDLQVSIRLIKQGIKLDPNKPEYWQLLIAAMKQRLELQTRTPRKPKSEQIIKEIIHRHNTYNPN